MSNWEYWEARIEEAARTGVVLLKEHNRHVVPVRKREPATLITAQEREAILSLHKQNHSLSEICAHTGRAKSSVWKVIKEAGGYYGK